MGAMRIALDRVSWTNISIAKYRHSNNIIVGCWSSTRPSASQIRKEQANSGHWHCDGSGNSHNIFSLRRSRGNEETYRWLLEVGRGVELVDNHPAGAHGSCPQLTY